MYTFKLSEHLQEIMKRLSQKDKSLYERLLVKIQEIITSDSVEHYKNLRHNLKDSKRVHIGHFVLIFQYRQKENTIIFDDFDHHDKIYK
ncbi:type II toxin-antitoxin system RelE/ParE family toxin [Candidatus Woesearchaeota archaeon]|nr:type II toxin-antitoxin system RelE/ParE family toxin [Candidatus Woesearchaeota archaeon]